LATSESTSECGGDFEIKKGFEGGETTVMERRDPKSYYPNLTQEVYNLSSLSAGEGTARKEFEI
jgi:hypothetical protein